MHHAVVIFVKNIQKIQIFLIDFTIEEALKKFIDKLENKNIFIYINNDDKKIIYYKNLEKYNSLILISRWNQDKKLNTIDLDIEDF